MEPVIYAVIIGILSTAVVPEGIKSGRWWIVMLSMNVLVSVIRHMGQ